MEIAMIPIEKQLNQQQFIHYNLTNLNCFALANRGSL